jgi:hypothetical protein
MPYGPDLTFIFNSAAHDYHRYVYPAGRDRQAGRCAEAQDDLELAAGHLYR